MEFGDRGIFLIFFISIQATYLSASRCPESRKPHPTSCTIYYNCINLPGGGYVWAPAKCSNGLVFQPYLRLCVLPGDSWTCDILATEMPETTTKSYVDFVDEKQSSYLGADENAPRYDEVNEDAMMTNSYSHNQEFQSNVTPVPLIEVASTNDRLNELDAAIKNFGVPIAVKHSEDNYLYHFLHGREKILAIPTKASNEQLRDHLRYLTVLVDRLVAQQPSGIPFDRQPPPPSTTHATTTEYHLSKFSDDQQASIVNYLLKNYLLKAQDTEATTVSSSSNSRSTKEDATITESPDTIINGAAAKNNIVVVMDGLGNREYFTMTKYKSIAAQLHGETVELLSCTSGIRLPNKTDCTRYYTCDPNTADIMLFSCPTSTAFNAYKRICETAEYEVCTTKNPAPLRISPTTAQTKIRLNDSEDEDEDNPCQTIGKANDPTSENHYYLCFTDMSRSNGINAQRMTCPNELIFCKTKSFCTTRKRCLDYQ